MSLLLFLTFAPCVSAHEAGTAAMFSQVQRLNVEIVKLQQSLHQTNLKLQSAVSKLNTVSQNNKKQIRQLVLVQGKTVKRVNMVEKRKSVPKGSILLMTKNGRCPKGARWASRFAIQVDRNLKSYSTAFNLRNGDTSWNVSNNYDGLLYRACAF